MISAIRPFGVFLIIGAAVFGQTTITYTDGDTDSTTYDTTGDNHTLALASGTATQSGVISGTGSIDKTGSGNLTLSATNTHSGGTTITAGTLTVSPTGFIPGDITNNATLVFNRSDDYTFNGVVSGTGALISDGYILRLSSAQTYTGTTTIKNGAYLVLSTSVDQGLAAATTVEVESGGTFDFSNRTLTLAGLTGSGSVYSFGGSDGHLTLDLESSNTFGGTLGATDANFALTKTGAGTLILTGANAHTGTTTLSQGTLQIGDGGSTGSLGTGGLANAGTLILNRSDTAGAYAGAITGTGAVTHNGSGTFTLSGDSSYTGSTTISSGTLAIGHGNALGSTAGGTTIASGANLTLSGTGSYSTAEALSGAGTLTKVDSGTWNLSGNNSYTGNTTVSVGTLTFDSTTAFYGGTVDATNAAKVSVADGATLGLGIGGTNSFTLTDFATFRDNASLTGTARIGLDTTAATDGSVTWTDTNFGTDDLTKLGTGTLVLAGTTTISGDTRVENGILSFAESDAFYGGTVDATNTAKLTVLSGATASFALGGTGYFSASDLNTVTSNATLESGSSLGVDTTQISSTTLTQSGTHNLNKLGAGTLTLDPASTGTGNITVTAGTLEVGNITSGTLSAAGITNNNELVFSPSNSLAFTGTLDGTGNFTKSGAGELTLSRLTSTGNITVTAGNLNLPTDIDDRSATISGATASLTESGTFTDVGREGTGSLNVTSGGSYVLTSTSALNYLTIGTLTGSNGSITVNGADSNIQSGGRLRVASSGTGALNIENGASASFNRTSDSYAGNTATGVGTITLTDTDSALTTGGRLVVGNAGTGTVTINSGATLTANRLQLAQDVGSTGTLNLNDGGTLIVSDASGTALETGAGTATFNFAGGTLKSNGSNSLTISSNATLADGTTSTIDTNGQSGAWTGVLSGTGNIIKAGTGILTLSGTNTHTGTTTISAGTLTLDASGTLANSSEINLGTTGSTGTLDLTAKSGFSMGSGQTLTGVGTVSLGGDTLTLNSGATFAPGNSAGLVNIDGDFTLNSGSIINLELGGLTRGTQYDAFNATGTLTLGGTLNVSLIDEYTPTGESTYNLFDAASVGGTFAAVNLPSVTNGTWNSSNLATTGEITLTVSAVPEPSSFAFLAGLFGFGLACLRRRDKTVARMEYEGLE